MHHKNSKIWPKSLLDGGFGHLAFVEGQKIQNYGRSKIQIRPKGITFQLLDIEIGGSKREDPV